MSAILTIGLPSKGRLKEKALAVFSKAGLEVEMPQDPRSYRGSVPAMPGIEIAFLSASEIARELALGNIELGVTGEDLAREKIPYVDEKLSFEAKLGFGEADVIVAVPEAWIDVNTMDDQGDVAGQFRSLYGRQMRVATKYFTLTTAFFSAKHGIDHYRIVESLGATEGAPAAGSADIIVDITTTGSTLKANQLKILRDGVILRSEANLVRSLVALPSLEPGSLAAQVFSRFKL